MRIEVKVQFDERNIDVYGFNLFGLHAVFVHFAKQTKPPGKRVWKNQVIWDKYVNNKVEEPKINQYVRDQCREEIIKLVKVMTWSEWKPNDN